MENEQMSRRVWRGIILAVLAAVQAFFLWNMWQRYGDALSGYTETGLEEKMYAQTDKKMAELEITVNSRRVRQGEKIQVDSLVTVEDGTQDITLAFQCGGRRMESGDWLDTSVPGIYRICVTAGIRQTGRKIKRTAVLLVDGRA